MKTTDYTAHHTPGPWVVETVDFENMKQVGTITSPTVSAGQYTRLNGSKYFPVVTAGGVTGRSLAECTANENLIAAAPELLECVLDLMAGHSIKGEEKARAIIAKIQF